MQRCVSEFHDLGRGSRNRLVPIASMAFAIVTLLLLGPSAALADTTCPTGNPKVTTLPLKSGVYGIGDENGCLVKGGPGGLVSTSNPIYLYGEFANLGPANPLLIFGSSQGAPPPPCPGTASPGVVGVKNHTSNRMQIVRLPPPGNVPSPATVWAGVAPDPLVKVGTYTYEGAWQACTVRDTNAAYVDGFEVHNNCAQDVYMYMTPPALEQQWGWWKNKYGQGQNNLYYKLAAGAHKEFQVPACGAPGGNFKFLMGCSSDCLTDCIIGSVSGDFAAPNTLFEITAGCDPSLDPSDCAVNPSGKSTSAGNTCSAATPQYCPALGQETNFDISVVDGFTLPITVQVTQGTNCNRKLTDGSMLDMASCPSETSSTMYSSDSTLEGYFDQGVTLLAKNRSGQMNTCASPKTWLNTTQVGAPTKGSTYPCPPNDTTCWYQCSGCPASNPLAPGCNGVPCMAGPEQTGQYAINNTNFVTQLFAMGYKGYTWPYQDATGDMFCDYGAKVEVTLCPDGGTPYEATQWAKVGNACKPATHGASPTYASLWECQKTELTFTCADVAPDCQDSTCASLCQVDPSGNGVSWDTCQAAQSQKCTGVSYNGSTVQNCIPQCSLPG